jgi:fibronectin type 3 domain-containing protein
VTPIGRAVAVLIAAAFVGAGAAVAALAGGSSPVPNGTTTQATTTSGDPPGPPTLSAAVAGENGIVLTWEPPTSDGGTPVTRYRVYRGTASGAEMPLTWVEATSYTATAGVKGTTYYYRVSALNWWAEGPLSNERSATATVTGVGALFRPYQTIPVGSWSEAVAVGDDTGDGRNDVVMTTSQGYYPFDPVNDYHLFVFTQRADGTLSSPISYPTAARGSNRPQSVAIGDITGDGKADVVVGIAGLGVQVFPQLASGSLGSPAMTSTGNSFKIRLGQLDGDARLDVAGVGWGTNTVSVLLNDGNGGLRTPIQYAAQHDGYEDLEIADVTSDGRDDLIVMSGQGLVPNISVVAQLATGGFGPAAEYRVGTNLLTNGIGVGDVTGDGRNDVVAGYGGNGAFVAVFAQTASGTLAGPVSYPSYDFPEPVDVADLDVDHLGDALAIHSASVGVYRQLKDGTLSTEERYPIPASAHDPHGLAIGDVNGDSAPDVVLADNRYGLVVLLNAAGATPPDTTVPGAPTLVSAVAGDSSVSLAWNPPPSSGGAAISAYKVYRGTSSGSETLLATLGAVTSYRDGSAVNRTTYYYRVSAVNSFGEGALSNERYATPIPEIVPGAPSLTAADAGISSVSLAWYAPASNGGPAITGYRVYRGNSSGGETLLATVSNVNQYLDTNVSRGTTYYYQVSAQNSVGEGPRSNELSAATPRPLFQPYQATWVGSWPEAVAIGDVTGDGRNDIVMTTSFYFDSANDYHLFVFAQAANGTLLPPVSYLTAGTYNGRPVSVAIGDITGDGKADVVVGLRGLGVQVFPQLAAGSLGAPTMTATLDSDKIRVGQFDGDGRLDVAGIGWGTNSVSVLVNDGNGGLRQPIAYAAQHAGYDDLEVADVTGDRRDDLVVMSGQNYSTPQISVLAQLAAGGFGPAAEYRLPVNELTHGIGVGDVTGDGRNDVVASYGGNGTFAAVFAQTTLGALAAPLSYQSYGGAEPVDVADADLDGLADVVTLHGGFNAAGVYRQLSNGALAPEDRYGIPYASHYNPHGLAVGDVNGDGSPDIVLADYNNGLVVLRNNTPPSSVPRTPTLSSGVAGNGSVSLTWSPPPSNGGSPSGYKVYRGTTSGAETLLATLGTASGFTDAATANGTTYYYEVSALNPVGESARSNELSATPRIPDPTPPSKPASLKLVVAGTNQLALDWPASTDNVGVTGYEILRGGSVVATVGQTQYLDSGLAAGTNYTYQVRAIDAAGNTSPVSSNLNAKTVASSTSSTGTLAGVVYDPTGTPLANAAVKLVLPSGATKSTKTNASGVWKFSNLRPALYPITVTLSGYQPRTLNLSAVAGKTVLATAVLAPA